MLASTLLFILSTLTAVRSAPALEPRKCFTTGSLWDKYGRRAASEAAGRLCQSGTGSLSGVYHGNKARSACVLLPGGGTSAEFKIEWGLNPGYTETLTEEECVAALRDEIYGCTRGGRSEDWNSKWSFK